MNDVHEMSVFLHKCVGFDVPFAQVLVRMRMYICIYTHMYIHMYACVSQCTRIRMYVVTSADSRMGVPNCVGFELHLAHVMLILGWLRVVGSLKS